MEYAYRHLSRLPRGGTSSGVVYAENEDLAYVKLKKAGYTPLEVTLDYAATVRCLIHRDFNRKELAKFYKSLGKRLMNGRSIAEGLENAIDFVNDQRLRHAVITMRQAILEGHSVGHAMAISGFSPRDVHAVHSTTPAGKTPETLLALSREIERVEQLRKMVRTLMRMPAIMLFMMYCAVYAMIVFGAPRIEHFFSKVLRGKADLPAYASAFYHFCDVFNQMAPLSSIAYLLVPGLFIMTLRAAWFQQLIELIPMVRILSERSDMAALWTSFGMLYESAVNPEEACKLLSKSATRQESAQCFARMAHAIRSGRSIQEAVEKAGFPGYIVRGIRSAESSGSLTEGIEDMALELSEDVTLYTESLRDKVQIIVLLGMGLFVLGFFMITYYPMVTSALKLV